MRLGPARGFTLVELMITVAVLAVLAAIAFPSFEGVMRSNRLATATNEAIASLTLARSEAIRSARPASVCGSTDGAACADDWSGGWLVWDDTNGDGTIDDGETLVRFVEANDRMTITGPEDGVITFDNRGRRANADDQEVVLRAKECGNSNLQVRLEITTTGRASARPREACS